MRRNTKRFVLAVVGVLLTALVAAAYAQATKRLDAGATKMVRYLEQHPEATPGWSDVARIAPVRPESTVGFGTPTRDSWLRIVPPEAAYTSIVTITNGETTKRYPLTMFVRLTREGVRSDFYLVSQAMPSR